MEQYIGINKIPIEEPPAELMSEWDKLLIEASGRSATGTYFPEVKVQTDRQTELIKPAKDLLPKHLHPFTVTHVMILPE